MRIFLLTLALSMLVSPMAHADDEAVARAHFITGRSYYDQNRYADALKEFQEAYRLSKRVGFLYNIGVCEEQLGQDDEALASFEGYIGSVADPAEQAEVQKRIDRIKARRAAKTTATAARAAAAEPVAGPSLTASAPRERPVWKRGWFWGVMTGAAVVVAGGVTLGVVLGTAHDLRTLPDVTLQ
jgi:hypothetical protein